MFQASDHKTRRLIHVVFQSPASSVLSNFHILRKMLRGPAHLSLFLSSFPSLCRPNVPEYTKEETATTIKKGEGKI